MRRIVAIGVGLALGTACQSEYNTQGKGDIETLQDYVSRLDAKMFFHEHQFHHLPKLENLEYLLFLR